MRFGWIVLALLCFGSEATFAEDYAGSALEIVGKFPAKGTSSAFTMDTLIEFGAKGEVKIKFGNRHHRARLNAGPVKNPAEYTLTCGSEIVGRGNYPLSIESSLQGNVFKIDYTGEWAASVKSEKCKEGFISGHKTHTIQLVAKLDNGGCRFSYHDHISDGSATTHDVTLAGDCIATGSIRSLGK